jgi:hypothetical protein
MDERINPVNSLGTASSETQKTNRAETEQTEKSSLK